MARRQYKWSVLHLSTKFLLGSPQLTMSQFQQRVEDSRASSSSVRSQTNNSWPSNISTEILNDNGEPFSIPSFTPGQHHYSYGRPPSPLSNSKAVESVRGLHSNEYNGNVPREVLLKRLREGNNKGPRTLARSTNFATPPTPETQDGRQVREARSRHQAFMGQSNTGRSGIGLSSLSFGSNQPDSPQPMSTRRSAEASSRAKTSNAQRAKPNEDGELYARARQSSDQPSRRASRPTSSRGSAGAATRPNHLDTALAQDISLPSPSLSPVTAAANLHHGSAGYFSSNMGDDSASFDSSFELRTRSENPLIEGSFGEEDKVNRTPVSEEGDSMPVKADNSMGSNSQAPCMTDMPKMVDFFDTIPDEMKTYVMYQLLRRCPKSTLHFVADVVNPALKCDFLSLLPLELSQNIVRYLDAKTLCRAAQVSKKWRHIVNSDERAWKQLFDVNGFVLAQSELHRAIREGWGWQHSSGPNGWEQDISSSAAQLNSDDELSVAASTVSVASSNKRNSAAAGFTSSSRRSKRKATAKAASRNYPKQKSRSFSRNGRMDPAEWLNELSAAEGPYAAANAAAMAVPYPSIGLPSLRSLHLYKSLYQRHHLISKSWMSDDVQPKHIAFRAHMRHVVTCLQFDTEKILTGSDDTNINVYDTKTGALRTKLQGHDGGVWALQYHGNVLVSGSTDRSVRVWDIEKGECMHVFHGHTSTVRCLQILMPAKVGETADGKSIMLPKQPLIITGSRDSNLRIWKLPQPGDRDWLKGGAPQEDTDCPYFVRQLAGHTHSVRAIAAHADTLVSGSYDCSVRVWKISTGETVHRLQGHSQKVYSVVLDHERNRCISGSMDNLVKIWSLETGGVLFNLEGHSSLVGLLDLSSDRLVSAAADSTLRIWDPETGSCKSTLSAHTGAITCFQHDGQKVISGSDRTLKMWNVKTGECVKDLLTDLSGVWQVKFNERRCVAAVQRSNLTYIEVNSLTP